MRTLFAACLFLCIVPLAACAQVWDLAADYSGTQNPNQTWSYGWRIAPNQPNLPLILYTDHNYPCPEFVPWLYDINTGCPCVVENPYDYPLPCADWVLPPHKVNFHPGPAQQCVVRWTAPTRMEVDLEAHFVSIDYGSKIVHIYLNGTELFTAPLANSDRADFSAALSVGAGDVVDCAIDPVSFYYDSTQIDATFTEVPPTPVNTATWGQVKARFR